MPCVFSDFHFACNASRFQSWNAINKTPPPFLSLLFLPSRLQAWCRFTIGSHFELLNIAPDTPRELHVQLKVSFIANVGIGGGGGCFYFRSAGSEATFTRQGSCVSARVQGLLSLLWLTWNSPHFRWLVLLVKRTMVYSFVCLFVCPLDGVSTSQRHRVRKQRSTPAAPSSARNDVSVTQNCTQISSDFSPTAELSRLI